jgi:hypothetical protein
LCKFIFFLCCLLTNFTLPEWVFFFYSGCTSETRCSVFGRPLLLLLPLSASSIIIVLLNLSSTLRKIFLVSRRLLHSLEIVYNRFDSLCLYLLSHPRVYTRITTADRASLCSTWNNLTFSQIVKLKQTNNCCIGIALLCFETSALEEDEGSASRPGRLQPPEKARCPLYRRLGGPQGRSGQVQKISPLHGFDPWTVQPVDSRYTDWATRPTTNAIILQYSFHPSLISTTLGTCLRTIMIDSLIMTF